MHNLPSSGGGGMIASIQHIRTQKNDYENQYVQIIAISDQPIIYTAVYEGHCLVTIFNFIFTKVSIILRDKGDIVLQHYNNLYDNFCTYQLGISYSE